MLLLYPEFFLFALPYFFVLLLLLPVNGRRLAQRTWHALWIFLILYVIIGVVLETGGEGLFIFLLLLFMFTIYVAVPLSFLGTLFLFYRYFVNRKEEQYTKWDYAAMVMILLFFGSTYLFYLIGVYSNVNPF